jgi:hypothetical protein
MYKYKSVMILASCSLLFLCANATFASCLTRIYKIKGVVVTNDKKPIQNSIVLIFFDKDERGVKGYTLVNGEFEIECFYNTFTRMTLSGDHVCDKSPASITVIIQKQNYLPVKREFKIKEIIYKDNIIILPPIDLY